MDVDDEEDKGGEDSSMLSDSKVDIEWANLGTEYIVNKERRYLYDWYKNKNNIEKIAKEDICMYFLETFSHY